MTAWPSLPHRLGVLAVIAQPDAKNSFILRSKICTSVVFGPSACLLGHLSSLSLSSVVHLDTDGIWQSNPPRNVVARYEDFEPRKNSDIDDAPPLTMHIPIFAEDVFDRCLGNLTARESRAPGPESLFAGNLVAAVVQLDFHGPQVGTSTSTE